MHTYILTMVILGWVGVLINILALGLQIKPSAPTVGNFAFRALFGICFSAWATYLIIQGN